jgi:metallo-beta-lactamase family protein
MASIRFLGAAGTVTGSRFLVEAAGRRVLVDAGLFQGMKELRSRNWEPFPVPPDSIDAVVLTHAHIDHSGALPLLVRSGFRGEAFCTPATADLARIMLPDSAKLQEEEARYANAKGYSRHAPRALPSSRRRTPRQRSSDSGPCATAGPARSFRDSRSVTRGRGTSWGAPRPC